MNCKRMVTDNQPEHESNDTHEMNGKDGLTMKGYACGGKRRGTHTHICLKLGVVSYSVATIYHSYLVQWNKST